MVKYYFKWIIPFYILLNSINKKRITAITKRLHFLLELFFFIVTIEKIRTKQDLEMLENKYSLDIVTFKTNLQECTNEIECLKKEVSLINYLL